jgi:hypothetical protein
MEWRIQVDASELEAALRQLPSAIRRGVLREAAAPTAEAIAARARELVPVDTGRTRDGIVTDVSELSAAVISSRQPMPSVVLWLERGTRKMAARPYMSVAAQLEEHRWLQRVSDALERALEEA